MPKMELELNPVEFITIGTVGPKGQRIFHLQAGSKSDVVTLTIEKEQAFALAEAIRELLEDLDKRFPSKPAEVPTAAMMDMELREPIEPKFRVAQMGLGYDEDRDMVVLVAQELLVTSNVTFSGEEDEDEEDLTGLEEFFGDIEDDESDDDSEPGIVRMWCNRNQMRALSAHSANTVQSGRPDPKLNGRLVYYWT